MQNKPKQTRLFNLARKDYLHIFVACFLFLTTVLATLSLKFLPTITGSVKATTDANLATNTITGDGGCSFTGTVTSAHSATISIGENSADFGSTKITTVCSNSLDHQVYAVGYSNETEGNTNLINTVDNTITIPTGVESGNISNWSMKISKDTSSYLPENITLENSFNSNHVVPNESTLISSYTGGTDTTTGSSILTTYSANVANNQIAGNYAGVVKYILTATTIYNITIKTAEGIDKVTLNNVECTSTQGCVVPNLISGQSYTLEVTPTSGYEFTGWNTITSGTIADSTATSTTYTIGEADETLEPEAERLVALLDTGQNVNKKLKSVASNATVNYTYISDTLIKSFQRSDTLPNDFVATTTNTISLATSRVPIYIFFDNTNDAGIMYYYARDNATIIANSNLLGLFEYMKALTEVPGLADWDTGDATEMASVFYGTSSLTDISGLANWDTAKVTSMGSMFYGTKIANADALATGKNSNPNIWNTGNVTDMNQMFYDASSLTDISGLANWDTAKVTNMRAMFNSTKIVNVDALATGKNSNPNIWNTGNVTNMSSMFSSANSLTNISGLANWDTAKVTDMSYMFRSTKIANVDALATGKNNNPNIWNTGNVTSMSYMFYYASLLTDISGLSDWDTAKVTSIGSMFYRTKIANVDALATGKNNNPNIWNTGNVTNMSSMFSSANSLTNISGLADWDTAKVTDMSYMFQLTKIANVDALATGKNNNPNIWNTGNVTSMSSMFESVLTLTDISGLSNWDTAKVTSMSHMLKSTIITNVNALATGKNNNPNIWNTGNVTNMSYMFSNVSSLTDISGLSDWDTAKVTNMLQMFYSTKITNANALATGKNNNPNIWNTGNVTNMATMFSGASTLTDISGLSDWDTSKVTNMDRMFQNTNITNVNALATGKNNNPNIWNTGNVTSMREMFSDASSLADISGLSNWDTAKVIIMYQMFYNDTALVNISSIAGWDVSSVTATAGTTSSNNYFYQMFYSVSSTATSGFAFTNRAGSINSVGTYVPSS